MPFKRQKSNVSPHYHDTRTLLRKYRDVMWNLEVSDLDLQEEFKAEYGLSTDALFVDNEVNKGGNRLENYARALERSKRMISARQVGGEPCPCGPPAARGLFPLHTDSRAYR